MSHCTVQFWQDKDQGGYTKTYTNPSSKGDLSQETWEGHDNHHMDDTIGSIKTGSQAWVQLYSQPNYQGRSYLLGPNQSVNAEDLSSEGKNMDDTIESFILYDTQPIVNPARIVDNFLDLYPNSDHTQYTIDNQWNSKFYSQDSQYRAYDPRITVNDDSIDVEVKFDHIINDNEDDHATLTFSMDLKGNFIDEIQVNYRMAHATHIPKWVIRIVDLEVNLIADIIAGIVADVDFVITDGFGELLFGEAGPEEVVGLVADMVTFCIDHANALFKFMFVIQDDGGTMNFPAVVSHGIARTIFSCYQEIFGHDPRPVLDFNWEEVTNALDGDRGDILKYSQNTNFQLNGFPFRIYFPDISYFYGSSGALLSLKLDANTDGEKDDHVFLQMTFSPEGHLYSILGTVDFFLDDYQDGYVAPTSGLITLNTEGELYQFTKDDQGNTTQTPIDYSSIEDALADLLQGSIDSTATRYGFQLSDQQQNLVGATSEVIEAIKAGLSKIGN